MVSSGVFLIFRTEDLIVLLTEGRRLLSLQLVRESVESIFLSDSVGDHGLHFTSFVRLFFFFFFRLESFKTSFKSIQKFPQILETKL